LRFAFVANTSGREPLRVARLKYLFTMSNNKALKVSG